MHKQKRLKVVAIYKVEHISTNGSCFTTVAKSLSCESGRNHAVSFVWITALYSASFPSINFPLDCILCTNILVWEIWYLISISDNGYISISITHSLSHTLSTQTYTHFAVARKLTLGFTRAWLQAPVERRVGVERSQSKVSLCLT